MLKNKPLFKNPFGESDETPEVSEKPGKPEKAVLARKKPEHSCPAGRRPVKGFTRKDGRKVAPFCAVIREPQASLSGVLKGTAQECRKAVEKMSGEIGCGEVLKKLEFLGRVSKDESVRKNAIKQAEWLKGQTACKVVRKIEKKDEKKEGEKS